MFQVTVAAIDSAGGVGALVVARSVLVASLALLLMLIGIRNRLAPAAALLLSIACVVGARPRFFLRPELFTLLLVPSIIWIFSCRREYSSKWWLLPLAGLTVIGINAHGAMVIAPVLMAGVLAAELLQMVVTQRWDRPALLSGLLGLSVTSLAVLVNPYGWRLLTVPVHLSQLVNQPHIPNPEWISPTPTQVPLLYIAVATCLVILGLWERRAGRWMLFAMAAVLAFRHIRNLGLFFVLLPIAVAPALASWDALTIRSGAPAARRRALWLAVCAVLVLAVSVAASPRPRFGFGFADSYFPVAACDFMDRESLPGTRLYNDVRFGGYLINRYGQRTTVFIDDRNEIHQDLLYEIWQIMGRSDVAGWSAMVARWNIDTALVRYHPMIEVSTPDGRPLGRRGFSALWFPATDWALVYWDNVAMVFVRRDAATPDLLDRHEYTVIRPDDLEHLEKQIRSEPRLAASALAEATRALEADPDNLIALQITLFVDQLRREPSQSATDP